MPDPRADRTPPEPLADFLRCRRRTAAPTSAQWAAVKIRWGLRVDSTEKAALVRYADSCPNVTLTVTRAESGDRPSRHFPVSTHAHSTALTGLLPTVIRLHTGGRCRLAVGPRLGGHTAKEWAPSFAALPGLEPCARSGYGCGPANGPRAPQCRHVPGTGRPTLPRAPPGSRPCR